MKIRLVYDSFMFRSVYLVCSFHMQSEGLRPVICSRSRAGFTLNIIDTPGLVEGGYINEHALDIIKRLVYIPYDFWEFLIIRLALMLLMSYSRGFCGAPCSLLIIFFYHFHLLLS